MENTALQTEFQLQHGFVKAKRKLIVNQDFIEFETTDKDSIRINWKDFNAIRWGVELINGYAFTLGRKYKIFIRDTQQDVIQINLISLYGMRKQQNLEDFQSVVKSIYQQFLGNHVISLMERIAQDEQVAFDKLQVDKTAIHFKYQKDTITVPWDDVVLWEYKGYFFLQHKQVPEQAIKVSYLEDWNGPVIYSLIQSSLQMLAMAMDQSTNQPSS